MNGRALALAVLLALGPAAALADTAPANDGVSTCRRIVALAPSTAELAFAMGLGPRVVGVGDYVHWPPEAADLPRLGGLTDPHREEILALHPDVVILLPSEASLGRQLRTLGIDTLEVPSDTITDVERAARALDARCPSADEGWIERFRRALAPRPVGAGRSVLLVVDRPAGDLTRALGAGPGTFYDELLRRLGAVNVLHDAPVAYPRLSLEEILVRDPDVIVELRLEAPDAATRARLRADWEELGALTAAANGRVRFVAGDYVLVPGPRLPLLYDALGEAVGDAP